MGRKKSENILSQCIVDLSNLCWGMLFHAMGLKIESVNKLIEVENSLINNMTTRVLKSIAIAIKEYNLKPENSTQENIFKLKKEIVKQIEGLLDTKTGNDIPKVSLECSRSRQKRSFRKANDSFHGGYSRDAFKEIKEEDKSAIALAAISYLIRANSLFFCRPQTERDFNAAKVSLNDIFQSSQLATRLYHSMDISHTNLFKRFYQKKDLICDLSQKEYLNQVKIGPLKDPPWESAFFIWHLHQLVEIERGNVYRSINFLNESDLYFKHAQIRFDMLANSPLDVDKEFIIDPHTDNYFICFTFIKALFERSKVLFDQGFFIESLLNQMRCIAYLMRIGGEFEHGGNRKILNNISIALNFFNVLKKQSTLEKETITKFFGLRDEADEKSNPKNEDIEITPDKILPFFKNAPNEKKALISEIFVHIGYLLLSFQRGNQIYGKWDKARDKQSKVYKTHVDKILTPFFKMGEDLNVLPPSSLAQYCLTIVNRENDDIENLSFPEYIERSFAHKLRKNNAFIRYTGKAMKESDFYGRLLDLFTQNIDNIITLPRRMEKYLMRPGYFIRRTYGDLSATTIFKSLETSQHSNLHFSQKDLDNRKKKVGNKFVVLRRWQSFNPKLPCRSFSHKARGGGHFFIWQGKGIVIDPGYDFIQNFYDEGFSLNDIDAVIITHSHPDHDDDLSTLTTLFKEWNNHFELLGYQKEFKKRIDLFLNESAHLKFASWLNASQFGTGRIVPLPLVVWNYDSVIQTDEIRGKNVFICLRDKYSFDLEIVPAWHDDVIGKTAAVGLKFHLFISGEISSKEPVGIIGYTGDTGVYIKGENGSISKYLDALNNIDDQYKDCDVLVANLGDVRLRDLATAIKKSKDDDDRHSVLEDSIVQLFQDLFCSRSKKLLTIDQDKITTEKIESFILLLITLNLVPSWVLNEILIESNTAINMLNKFIIGESITSSDGDIKNALNNFFKKFEEIKSECGSIESTYKSNYLKLFKSLNAPVSDSKKDYKKVGMLLLFLCSAASSDWSYEYHLGVSGLYKLYKAMSGYIEKQDRERIFIVAELPEELSSYRHHIARFLNVTEEIAHGVDKKKVFSFTGDIGLHIRLLNGKKEEFNPKIRCTYCNHNNETILSKKHYHSPGKIVETSLKRLDSAMIYLCTTYDHFPENAERPLDFLSRPVLRVI